MAKIFKEYYFCVLVSLWYIFNLLPFPSFQYTDGLWIYLPRLSVAAKELVSGHIPFWNQFQFCGIPFLADAATELLNPLSVFYFFINPGWAYTFETIILFFLLVLGAWKYFRIRNFSKTSSMVGTLGFVLGGPLIFWSLYHSINLPLALFPFTLYAFRKFENTGLARWNMLAFALIFFSASGGLIQFSFFTALSCIIEGIEKFSFADIFKTLKRRGLTVLLGVLSASIIILPTVETLLNSHRRVCPYYRGTLPDTYSLMLMMFFGDSGGSYQYPNYLYYVGIILLALACFGLRKNFRQMVNIPYFLYSLAPVLILIAVYSGILPTNFQFGVESDPFRGMFIFIFALSLLAAHGTESIIKKIKENNGTVVFPFEFLLCMAICLYLAISLNISCFAFLQIIFGSMFMILASGLMLSFISARVNVPMRLKTDIAAAWIIILITVNGFSAAQTYIQNNVIHGYEKMAVKQWEKKGVPLSLLRGEGRVVHVSPDRIFDGLFEHWSVYYGIRSLGGYGVYPRSIFIRMRDEGFFPDKFNAASHFRNNRILDTDVLAKYGVLYLVEEKSNIGNIYKLNDWQFMRGFSDINIYKNPKYVGRAYIVDPHGNITKGVETTSMSGSKVKMSTDANAGDTIILADSWFPGWQCYDNGKKVTGFDAGGFRGYKTGIGGRHDIEWVYEPASFFIGTAVSVVSMALFFLINIYGSRREN